MRVTPILRAGGHGSTNPFKFKSEFKTPKTSYKPSIPDPAWEAWVNMKNDQYKGFKLTSKTVRFVIAFNVIMPTIFVLMDQWEKKQEFSQWDGMKGVPFAKIDRKPEDLWTNPTLQEYKIFDEPPIKISTWKD
ncbi:hypothetical protein BDY24DRAFT_387063 [Mrakia frigida]|uniref:uncharacterized protein n=1 Tax=Mrakia frigida TaxID=29902 RepID=UPI003FCC112C